MTSIVPHTSEVIEDVDSLTNIVVAGIIVRVRFIAFHASENIISIKLSLSIRIQCRFIFATIRVITNASV